MKLDWAKKFSKALMLMSISALAMTFMWSPWNISWLAWVALVPFMLACSPTAGKWTLAVAAFCAGFAYWVGNLYWLWYVTSAGQIGVSAYLAFYWVGLALAVRFARTRRWPLFLAAPVLWVAAEAFQGWLFTGFGWRFLSHSQYQNLWVIQISDIFGAAGVSFVIALVNGAIADSILVLKDINLKSRTFKDIFIKEVLFVAQRACICIMVLATVLWYACNTLLRERQVLSDGPVVAAVQSNVPQDVKEQADKSDEMFAEMMIDSEVAAQTGAKLIVWPETMVQGLLNPEVLAVVDSNSQWNIFDRALRAHAKSGNTNLLIGSTGGTVKTEDGVYRLDKRYNSAFLYNSDGSKSQKVYNKMHLVPFGEVVPFKKSVPPLYKLLMSFTPYDYDYTLDYGQDYTIFQIEDANRTYNFATLICYEDVVPYVARNFANADNGKKAVDFMVNISNDGWFVRYNSKVKPSTELEQHMAICVFRAIENRTPIVRSVNTGISCVIDSDGRIRNGYMAGRMPQAYIDRQGVRGWFADRLALNSSVSFFTRHGQVLEKICIAAVILTIAFVVTQAYRNRKKA